MLSLYLGSVLQSTNFTVLNTNWNYMYEWAKHSCPLKTAKRGMWFLSWFFYEHISLWLSLSLYYIFRLCLFLWCFIFQVLWYCTSFLLLFKVSITTESCITSPLIMCISVQWHKACWVSSQGFSQYYVHCNFISCYIWGTYYTLYYRPYHIQSSASLHLFYHCVPTTYLLHDI